MKSFIIKGRSCSLLKSNQILGYSGAYLCSCEERLRRISLFLIQGPAATDWSFLCLWSNSQRKDPQGVNAVLSSANSWQDSYIKNKSGLQRKILRGTVVSLTTLLTERLAEALCLGQESYMSLQVNVEWGPLTFRPPKKKKKAKKAKNKSACSV